MKFMLQDEGYQKRVYDVANNLAFCQRKSAEASAYGEQELTGVYKELYLSIDDDIQSIADDYGLERSAVGSDVVSLKRELFGGY